MMTFTVRSHIGKDGLLNLQVPVGVQDTDVEVVVVLQPQKRPSITGNGFPPSFFEETFGSLPALKEIEPPGAYEIREDLNVSA